MFCARKWKVLLEENYYIWGIWNYQSIIKLLNILLVPYRCVTWTTPFGSFCLNHRRLQSTCSASTNRGEYREGLIPKVCRERKWQEQSLESLVFTVWLMDCVWRWMTWELPKREARASQLPSSDCLQYRNKPRLPTYIWDRLVFLSLFKCWF